jgi:hypothetical protein
MKDLREEFSGMVLTNKMVQALGNISLHEKDYRSGAEELATALEKEVTRSSTFTADEKRYIKFVCENMRIWTDACDLLRK